MHDILPVVVIGAGPVGLAAASHLLGRGFTPLVLEAGDVVGAGMRRWSHVRMFSPWEFTIDKAARELLERDGWSAPDLAAFPTGGEVVERYLQPLARVPQIAPHLRLGARVTAVARQRRDRMKDSLRNEVPFVVRYQDATGEHELLAQALIDASGTVETPNPIGSSGIPALGENALRDRIFYGMPDVLGADRARYAGKRVLVVGSGHSAFNVLNDLARLSEQVPGTQIQWALRRPSVARVLGGGENDQLRERGKLGLTIGRLVDAGVLQVATGFHLERLEATDKGLIAHDAGRALPAVDEIVATTGFRPELSLLSELRVALDHGTQAPVALAPLIDPNQHSCGSVRPHGARELSHPDANFFIVGMKSYGRAPTFLLLTGYEQVRSVVAAIAGDWDAAERVELVLPETGVCITHFAHEDSQAIPEPAGDGYADPSRSFVDLQGSGCCGGPAAPAVDACCNADAAANSRGGSGCGSGCGATAPISAAPMSVCCAPSGLQ